MARNKQKTIAVTEDTHLQLTRHAVLLSYHQAKPSSMDETIGQLMRTAEFLLTLRELPNEIEVADAAIGYLRETYPKE